MPWATCPALESMADLPSELGAGKTEEEGLVS